METLFQILIALAFLLSVICGLILYSDDQIPKAIFWIATAICMVKLKEVISE